MPLIRNLFFKALFVFLIGLGAVMGGTSFVRLAAAQEPSGVPASQATGNVELNGASLDYFPREHLFRV
ncbi:MAG: hypothetical protein JO212_12965, partial [Acetobacteraceae bacterium]|nr:hypothetical protein [Acetobacteraceae bacterium]